MVAQSPSSIKLPRCLGWWLDTVWWEQALLHSRLTRLTRVGLPLVASSKMECILKGLIISNNMGFRLKLNL
jgi:hypothetical protein